jgi:hypothetical protein
MLCPLQVSSARAKMTVVLPLGNLADRDGGFPTLRIAVLILLIAGLAGCGSYRWQKPGYDRADFQRESEECRQQAAGGPPPGGGQPSADKLWENCMMGRGWRYSGTSWF